MEMIMLMKRIFFQIIVITILTILPVGVISAKELLVPKQYPSIQAAIDVANDRDIIVISPGIYQENIDFKGKAIIVSSTDPDNEKVVASTIIDGGSKGSVVSFTNGETEDAVLKGLTLTKGGGTEIIIDEDSGGNHAWLPVKVGGGIFIKGSSPSINANIISGNKVGWQGGGIYMTEGSSPNITGNTITGNSSHFHGGGICVQKKSTPTITGNTISGNKSRHGAGVQVGGSGPAKIIDNTIINNRGSFGVGISAGGSTVEIINNKVIGNKATAKGGGVELWGSSGRVEGNVISDNSSGIRDAAGGGMFVVKSNLDIIGNTISGNICNGAGRIWWDTSFSWGGAAICIWDRSNVFIKDNNIFDNISIADGGAISLHRHSVATIQNNNFSGNKSTAGIGGAIYVHHDSAILEVGERGEGDYNLWWPRVKNPPQDNNTYSNNYPDDINFGMRIGR
jgi:parallel beta-helix repeat protein